MRTFLPAVRILCSILWIVSCAETGIDSRKTEKEPLQPCELSDLESALVFVQTPETPETALGEEVIGIIIHPNGLIVTTQHILKSKVEVVLQDQRRFSPAIVGQDPATNLAVLKIESAGLRYLCWADPDSVKVGDQVRILDRTGSTQIRIVKNVGASSGAYDYEDFIEVEEPLFASSGALVNMKGQLIGIKAVYFSNKKGLAYAISRDLAKEITDRLIKQGKVRRAWTGVAIQKLTPELSKSFNANIEEGVLVSDVNEYGAAYEAGMRRGDVIAEVDDKPIKNPSMYRNYISLREVGSEVRMKVIRNGQPRIIYLHLREIPKQKG